MTSDVARPVTPRIAVLDDYQHVALANGGWSRLAGRAGVTVFDDHLFDEDALAARLAPFSAVVLMRERTPFPPHADSTGCRTSS